MKSCRFYPFLTKIKAFATYRWRTHSRWQFALIPVVSSNDTTYGNMVSIRTEKHNRYVTYITTYPPSSAHVFNTTRTVLHMLRERIHILRKRSQDIPRSSRPRCVIMISRTTDMQSLPHDRDCPQANLILRGQVRDSHHPTGGSLSSYHIVDASLQKINCLK
jgi:hypothetical protein